jgi:hypothetical protein
MTSYMSLWQRQYGGINNNMAVGNVRCFIVKMLYTKKKYNTYCLDVVTSISVMIRMIRTIFLLISMASSKLLNPPVIACGLVKISVTVYKTLNIQFWIIHKPLDTK